MAEKEYIERGAALKAVTYNPIKKPTEPDIIGLTLLTAQKHIRKIPAADVVEVVRCKDCKHSSAHDKYSCYCHYLDESFSLSGFCSYGERKEQK